MPSAASPSVATPPPAKPDRFEHRPLTWVALPDPTFILIGVADRAKFDLIAAPLVDHGQQDHGHVLTKSVEDRSTGVSVTFQFWINNLKPEHYRQLDRVAS